MTGPYADPLRIVVGEQYSPAAIGRQDEQGRAWARPGAARQQAVLEYEDIGISLQIGSSGQLWPELVLRT